MRRWARAFGFLGLAFLFTLVGCNRPPEAVRVAVFTSDPMLIKILNNVVNGIETRHPGLKVQLENIPYNSFQDKITTEIVAGRPPDVISVEANNFVDLYLRDAFVDLTDLAQRDGVDPKSFYPAIMGRYSPGGRIYAIPSDMAPLGLVYYNKKVFQEAGVPYPTEKWAWPEPFLSMCKKLVKFDATGKQTRWAFAEAYNISAETFMLSNGGYFTDSEINPTKLALDSPECLEAFQFRWDMIHLWHVSPTQSQIQAFNFGNGSESMFINGNVAMMNSGIWHTPNFLSHKELDFDIVQFPHGPRGTQGWGSGGTGYAIAKGSKRQEDAWTVVKELTGPELEAATAETGMIQPALIKVAESDAFLKSPGAEHKKILLDMTKYARFGPFMKNWNEIWYGQVGPALDPCWIGTKKPDEVLQKLVPELNQKYFPKK